MKTHARKDGDDWIINGSKMWITNGNLADIAIVWAPTEAGIMGFVLAKGLSLSDAEREYIRLTLSECDSVQQASEVLGVSRKNLWEKRKKHGLLKGE